MERWQAGLWGNGGWEWMVICVVTVEKRIEVEVLRLSSLDRLRMTAACWWVGRGEFDRRTQAEGCATGGITDCFAGDAQRGMKRISWSYDAHIGRADTGLHSVAAGIRGRVAGGRGGTGAEDSCGEAGVE